MRKLAFLFTLAFIAALPALADSGSGRAQSYFTYDDGGTIIHQGDDGREAEARVNMPVFPGDEVVTGRRGRSEIRLSDGNVLGIDRATAVRFKSILDSYEGDASQTTVELTYGHVMVHRTAVGSDYVRLDTDMASYVAPDSAVYAVDTDRGKDRITVFEGSVEVRTPNRRSRLRAGEEARVDGQGVYGLVSNDSGVADEFERWFLRRAERYDRGNSRYLDSSLAYADSDLDSNGSWIYVSSYGGWAWRPYVAVGWRPYYHGSWVYGPSGCLVWVSDEPWGWVPYHYGRWAYDPGYGWFWMPGAGYAPAWVYWMYGSGYIGWAPAGYWDCYRPYYNWCYRPYSRAGLDYGFGFFGRVRVHDVDLRPWTIIEPNGLTSRRADRAALTIDAVRGRLARDTGGYVTVSNTGARFTRDQQRDPGTAVNTIVRRGLGGGEGSSPVADVTPFIRRDPEIASGVRERVTRNRPADAAGSIAPIGRGSVSPIGGGSVAPVGRGSVAPIDGGSVAPIGGSSGRVGRDIGSSTPAPAPGASRGNGGDRTVIHRNGYEQPADRGNSSGRDTAGTAPSWRDRVERPSTVAPAVEPVAPEPDTRTRDDGSWRGRAVRSGGGSSTEAPAPAPSTTERRNSGSSDVPRRVIDRIGGARISGDRGSSGDNPPRTERAPSSDRHSAPPPSHNDGGSRGSSSSGSSGKSSSSGSSGSSSGSSSRGSSSRGSSSDSGRVHRDHN